MLKNVEEARNLAEKYLAELPMSPPAELAILDERTMETAFSWVFIWNSKRYHEPANLSTLWPAMRPCSSIGEMGLFARLRRHLRWRSSSRTYDHSPQTRNGRVNSTGR